MFPLPVSRRFVRRLFRVVLIAQLGAWLHAADVTVDFGSAVIDTWVQPQYPEAARKAKLEGVVTVEFVVELDGTVTRERVGKSTNAVFDQAALAAVRQWHFKPALEDAKPAASGMEAPVLFNLEQLRQKKAPALPSDERYMPRPARSEPAQAEGGMDPEYPAELEDQRLPGVVRMQITVGPDGRVHEPRVLFASHPAFVETALRTLERAKFTPAHQGPLPRAATMEYPVEFEGIGAKPVESRAANHLELLGDGTGVPRPFVLIQPVYPRDRLLAGETAKVTAEFTVNAEGQTEDVIFADPAGTDWQAAMRAAIESWAFQPARGGQGPVAVRLRVTHEFVPVEASADGRLVERLRPGGEGIAGAAGLDQKLKPLWRGFPVYPKSLTGERPAGNATIEFVIDRGGRARAVRIVSATADEFGWAAAAAITQWVFAPPLRNGQPADVLVRIPVEFQPPQS